MYTARVIFRLGTMNKTKIEDDTQRKRVRGTGEREGEPNWGEGGGSKWLAQPALHIIKFFGIDFLFIFATSFSFQTITIIIVAPHFASQTKWLKRFPATGSFSLLYAAERSFWRISRDISTMQRKSESEKAPPCLYRTMVEQNAKAFEELVPSSVLWCIICNWGDKKRILVQFEKPSSVMNWQT